MKINQYVMSLLPNFDKQRVLEDIRLTRSEIQEVTMPAFEAAAPFLTKWKFKSEEITELFVGFKRIVGASGSDNPFVQIHKAFPNILKNLDAVESMIDKVYGEEIAGTGLTYLKANLLQFVEAAYFVSRYARKFLLYTYVYETSQFSDSGTSIAESLMPIERQWIEQNFTSFCQALKAVSGNPGNVRKSIDDIPDVVATPSNVDTLGKTIGEDKIDPFQMRFIPVKLNPIYHIRMAVAEWQAARYRQAKEELSLLQLRLINLEQVSDKKPDANLQKRINSLESRIQDSEAKVAKMERDHA